jgi:hypothetical protein
MLSRYSHVRMEAKRRARRNATRQRAANAKRQQKIKRKQRVAIVSQTPSVQ